MKPKGSGHIQKRVRAMMLGNAHATLTITEAVALVYPGKPYTESRRVVVQRSLNALTPTLGWKKRRKGFGKPARYIGPAAAAADQAARQAFLNSQKVAA